MIKNYDLFFKELATQVNNANLCKLTLSVYKGNEPLKTINVKPVLIKNELHYSITYAYKTNDVVKNVLPHLLESMIAELIAENKFTIANLFSNTHQYVLELKKTMQWSFKTHALAVTKTASLAHNDTKNKLITSANKPYLVDLGLTSKEGVVLKDGADKYKQINHYIELLSHPLIKLDSQALNIVDMGCGKGYLTFALYDYLVNTLNKKAFVIGVDNRAALISWCNSLAQKCNYTNLKFETSTIEQFIGKQMDVLIALHACDTATDDAIKIGIENNAKIIVVAPCCHQQVRKSMKVNNANHLLGDSLKHGIFWERQAEMITDTIRALVLEYFGYSVKIMEFTAISDTPKNILIIATLQSLNLKNQELIKQKISALKTFWNLDFQYLASKMLDK
jgi:SAM-dependent methyltransferase